MGICGSKQSASARHAALMSKKFHIPNEELPPHLQALAPKPKDATAAATDGKGKDSKKTSPEKHKKDDKKKKKGQDGSKEANDDDQKTDAATPTAPEQINIDGVQSADAAPASNVLLVDSVVIPSHVSTDSSQQPRLATPQESADPSARGGRLSLGAVNGAQFGPTVKKWSAPGSASGSKRNTLSAVQLADPAAQSSGGQIDFRANLRKSSKPVTPNSELNSTHMQQHVDSPDEADTTNTASARGSFGPKGKNSNRNSIFTRTPVQNEAEVKPQTETAAATAATTAAASGPASDAAPASVAAPVAPSTPEPHTVAPPVQKIPLHKLALNTVESSQSRFSDGLTSPVVTNFGTAAGINTGPILTPHSTLSSMAQSHFSFNPNDIAPQKTPKGAQGNALTPRGFQANPAPAPTLAPAQTKESQASSVVV